MIYNPTRFPGCGVRVQGRLHCTLAFEIVAVPMSRRKKLAAAKAAAIVAAAAFVVYLLLLATAARTVVMHKKMHKRPFQTE